MMISTTKRGFGIGVMLGAVLALFAAVCGVSSSAFAAESASSSSPTKGATCSSGSLTGAGSTFVANLALEWIKNYTAQCKGASINYQPVGSGAGITQLTAGTVQFGATDVPLTAAQAAALQPKGATVQVPWAAGAISLEYNLSGVHNLKLDANTIAQIFSGQITKWNASAIKKLNSGVSLPSTTITTVHRSDSSGTTGAFTAYMSQAAPSKWTDGQNKTWPAPGGQGAKGSDGVTATVKQTSGAIGYAEVSYAVGAELPVVEVKNAGGKFTSPENSSDVATTLSTSKASATTGVVNTNYTTKNPNAYPIATPTYVVVLKSQSSPLVKNFLNYAVTNGQSSARSLYYVQLPSSIVTVSKKLIGTISG